MTKEVLVRIAGLHFDLKENGETDLQEAEDEKDRDRRSGTVFSEKREALYFV